MLGKLLRRVRTEPADSELAVVSADSFGAPALVTRAGAATRPIS